MTNTLCLDENYSTTKLLTREKSIIENRLEDKFESVLFLPENENRKGEGGLRTQGYFKKSYDDKPLITVVTVVYNGEEHLEQTIKSVIEQNYDNIEYIIVDGESTDDTIKIIEKYEDQIDYWVSEPDSGIFDAMNKGLSLSTGNYIGFINAGDYYNFDIFVKLTQEICQYPGIDIFYGDEDVMSEKNIFLFNRPPKILNGCLGRDIPHQSTFIKLDVHLKYKFETYYKIAADRILFAELLNNNHTYKRIPFTVSNFIEGGASSNKLLARKENYLYDYRYFGLLGFFKLRIIGAYSKFKDILSI